VRLLGFCVVQIHLTYNLPTIFEGDLFRTQWDSSMLQLQKSLETLMSSPEMGYLQILHTKKEVVIFCLALRDQLGVSQDLSFLNGLIKL